MSDRATIQIPRGTFERHNTRRKELGLTWSEYIDQEAPSDPVDYDEVERRVEKVLEE